MTYEEWLVKAHSTQDPNQRYGQWLWNTLKSTRPDITNALVATEVDPFYRDDLVPAFLSKAARLW